MALSSTSSSITSNEGSQQYPYPCHVNASSFLSIKLCGKHNFIRWGEQMFCLVDSHDMLGFIDGTVKIPQRNDGSKTKADISAFEAKYREWKRSDTLVKGWIFGSLSEDVMATVVGLRTANDVWNKLIACYTPPLASDLVTVTATVSGTARAAVVAPTHASALVCAPVQSYAPAPAYAPAHAPAPAYAPVHASALVRAPGHASALVRASALMCAPVVGSTSTATRKKELEEYIPLYIAIQTGDWEKAKKIFDQDKDSLIDKLNIDGNTAVHVAVGDPENVWFLENLLQLITPESLTKLVDNKQRNPLHYAAILDNTKASKKLVEKSPDLLFTVDIMNYLPIQQAVFNSHKTTFLYLLQVCEQHKELSQKHGHYNPFEGDRGTMLVCHSISSGFLDVAYDLLKAYPDLARTNASAKALLWNIAKKWDAFPSAKRYNFYQRFVYSHVSIATYQDKYEIQDIENQETYRGNPVTKCTKSYVHPVMERIYATFWKFVLAHVSHIKHLHEDKVKHKLALQILKFICKEVGEIKPNNFGNGGEAFIVAVKNNTSEVIEHISRTFPQSIWTSDNDYSLSQLSIMNRCENVYNFLVHEVTHYKYLHNKSIDKDENNLLHLAGKLAPTDKLSMVTGAALQMQRELQWFQEVSKFVRPKEMEAKNKNKETPIMVFKKEHKDLRKEGEEWMKKTADSYTITAALIITIAFASAITVPGGNNGDNGKAIYETQKSFIIFVVSNAISFFTSTTSLLLFLSILTTRCAEEDFLYKLPKRLILGLVMLFMSVTTMMIAFSATLYTLFGQEKSWILIPIAAITCLPIASFVTLQLPLLVDLISSTYGRGIFGKRSELRITS